MGWLWFIPTFHMPQPPPLPQTPSTSGSSSPLASEASSGSSKPSPPRTTKTTFHLTRKELDFPVGIGSAILDVDVEMEWIVPSAGDTTEPPVRARTEDSQIGTESEPAQTGLLAAAVQTAVGGGNEEVGSGLREAVETQQGAVE